MEMRGGLMAAAELLSMPFKHSAVRRRRDLTPWLDEAALAG